MFFATLLILVTQITEIPTQEITDAVRWNRLLLRKFEIGIVKAFETFRSNGIEPILIKGWAASRNYPFEKPRPFSDIDLAVANEEYPRAEAYLNTLGYAFGIDLHREFRHLDTVSWDILFDRSELVEVDGIPIRVLCPEDHLRVLCVHWLTDGGAFKERLWDIYYAVSNRRPDFDWDLCLNSVSPRRQKWIITTIALAHEYLDLDTSTLPFTDATFVIPKWIISTVESEWNSDIRLRPLHTCFRQPGVLMQQIRKRIPPNAIQATIDVEGEFNDRLRIPYQLGSIFKRIPASLRRMSNTLIGGSWK